MQLELTPCAMCMLIVSGCLRNLSRAIRTFRLTTTVPYKYGHFARSVDRDGRVVFIQDLARVEL